MQDGQRELIPLPRFTAYQNQYGRMVMLQSQKFSLADVLA